MYVFDKGFSQMSAITNSYTVSILCSIIYVDYILYICSASGHNILFNIKIYIK